MANDPGNQDKRPTLLQKGKAKPPKRGEVNGEAGVVKWQNRKKGQSDAVARFCFLFQDSVYPKQ